MHLILILGQFKSALLYEKILRDVLHIDQPIKSSSVLSLESINDVFQGSFDLNFWRKVALEAIGFSS